MVDQKLTELTDLPIPIASDIIYLVDDPSVTPLSRKGTLENLFKVINTFTALTNPDAGDFIALYDATASAIRKMDYKDLVKSSFIVAVSDETTVLPAASTTVPLVTFRVPFGFTVTGVRASLTTAGTGAALVTVDIHDSGTTILSTKITIDATEKTSETAATPPVISDSVLADDAEIELFLDVRDTDNVATGLKVTIVGYRT